MVNRAVRTIPPVHNFPVEDASLHNHAGEPGNRNTLIVEPHVAVSMDLDHIPRVFGYEVYTERSRATNSVVQIVRGSPPNLALVAVPLAGES